MVEFGNMPGTIADIVLFMADTLAKIAPAVYSGVGILARSGDLPIRLTNALKVEQSSHSLDNELQMRDSAFLSMGRWSW